MSTSNSAQTSEPPPSSTISLLKCGTEHIATKRWTRDADGKIVKIGCDNPKWYMVHPRPVTGIHELHQLFVRIENDPQACIIRGFPAHGVDVKQPVRRMKHPDPEAGGKIWFDEQTGQPWLLCDLDKVPVPEWINPVTDPEAAIRYLIATYLPPELRDVTCVWQWSSSTGMQSSRVVSVHLWFWLDRPMTGNELKAWCFTNEWLQAHENHIDTALFNDVQVHYTAEPVFEGVENPLRTRIGLREGTRQYGSLVIPQEAAADSAKKGNRRKKGAARDAATEACVDPISAAHGFEAKLAFLGDDGGKNRFGFHRPLIAAIAAIVYECGSGFDRQALKERLRQAIQGAPKREDRALDIERYGSDGYLDTAIASAIEKFGKEADDRIAAAEQAETDFFERYLWVEEQETFFDLKEHLLVSEKNVKLRHPEIGDPAHARDNAAYRYQTNTKRRRFVHNETYWPGEGLLVQRDGRTLVNTWRAHDFKTRPGDAEPYLDLLKRLFPEERDQNLILNKMAYAVQHRGEKPNWHMILSGAPGAGKDTLLKPMLEFFGDNSWCIGADDLLKAFNGFSAHEQVVVQELHTKHGRDVLNKLKPWLASPPDWINVDEKNKKPYQIRNSSSWWFTTNEPDAIKFDDSDRRFCVLRSPMTPAGAKRLAEEGYFKKLYAWLQNGGSAEVVHMLMQRELPPDFDAQGHAPWTAAKGEMITACLGTVGQYIDDAIRAQSGVFADDIVTIDDIVRQGEHDLPHADRKDLSTFRIKEGLKAAGARQLPQIRVGGRHSERLRLWAIREPAFWEGLSASDLRAAVKADAKTAVGRMLL